ncbi:MAG: tetratricopeptide repeat protein, partial [Planctomycetota bacterium]
MNQPFCRLKNGRLFAGVVDEVFAGVVDDPKSPQCLDSPHRPLPVATPFSRRRPNAAWRVILSLIVFVLSLEVFVPAAGTVGGSASIVAAPIPATTDEKTGDDETDAVSAREKQVVDRFLEVLYRRPRPGTALDRVVDFYQRSGAIDDLLEQLQVNLNADADDDSDAGRGAKAMVGGLIQLRRGKAADAAARLRVAETLRPQDAMASYQLGRSLLQIGQTQAAAAAITRATGRNPSRAEATEIFTTLAQIYSRAGNRDKAIEVWNQLQQQFPGDSKIGGRIAEELARAGDAAEARKRFLKLSETARPSEAALRFAVRAAEMLRQLDRSEEATKELDAAIAKTRPGSWLYRDIRRRIELGFTAEGDFAGLADYYQNRIAKHPEDLSLPLRLARLQTNRGRLRDAKTLLESSIKLAPTNVDLKQAMIDVRIAGGELSQAAQLQRELVSADPDNSDFVFALARTLSLDSAVDPAERKASAAKVLTDYAGRRRGDAVVLAQIAQRLVDLDAGDAAIEVFQQAVDADPASPQYREYLGETLFRRKQVDQAIAVWRSMAEGSRRNRESLVRLAETFTAFELQDQAIEAWAAAAELDLPFSSCLRYAEMLTGAEKFTAALDVLDQAEGIAESPDDRDQLLAKRIATHTAAGTLEKRIEKIAALDPTPERLRELAIMHQAAGQLVQAEASIRRAIDIAPDDVAVLSVAAEIAERQKRYADAAFRFEELAKIDRRFQVSHLKRYANLRMTLGQIDPAIEACRRLIEANPAAMDSYLYAAQIARRGNRDSVAEDFLRQAINVAPRDIMPRNRLAKLLAEKYRTDAAISLYWESFELGDDDDRTLMVGGMASLYERRGEVETLIERLESWTRTQRKVSERQLGQWIVTAYESVRYSGAALAKLDELQLRFPEDIELLQRAVSIADGADDLDAAMSYQSRLVKQADTPENRLRLITLQWEAGDIETKVFLRQRLSTMDSPRRMFAIAKSAARIGNLDAAEQVCRSILERDDSLWDVKLALAQILAHRVLETLGDLPEERNAKTLESEVLSLCEALSRFTADQAESLPPTARPSRGNATNAKSADPMDRNRWLSSLRSVEMAFRIGNYSDGYYASLPGVDLAIPTCRGQARTIAAAIQMLVSSQPWRQLETIDASDPAQADKQATQVIESLQRLTDDIGLLNDPDRATWLGDLYHDECLRMFAGNAKVDLNRLLGAGTISESKWRQSGLPLDDSQTLAAAIRGCRLDPLHGVDVIVPLLEKRLPWPKPKDGSDPATANEKLQPLAPEQLESLAEWMEQSAAAAKQRLASTRVKHHVLLENEWRLAGDLDQARKFALKIDEPVSKPDQVNHRWATIGWWLKLGKTEQAATALPKLLEAVREVSRKPGTTDGRPIVYSLVSSSAPPSYEAFVKKNMPILMDIAIAQAAMSAPDPEKAKLSATGDVSVSAYSASGSYFNTQVRSTLSPALVPPSLLKDIGHLAKFQTNFGQQASRVDLPDAMVAYLAAEPPEDFSRSQRRMRMALAAVAEVWREKVGMAITRFENLHAEFPEDLSITIELARMYADGGKIDRAIEVLDRVEPLGPDMLVRKELAILNLAAKAGKRDRAGTAAERLFGMRMDRATQRALADRLSGMGMKDRAIEILRRNRGGSRMDIREQWELARALQRADDSEVAAEIALDMLQRLSMRRSGNTAAEYYRRQAASILRSAGKLDSLIAKTRDRFEASPGSGRLRNQLIELYTAAGETEKATEIMKQAGGKASEDPRFWLSQAKSEEQADRYLAAAEAYATAFALQPTQISNHAYELTNLSYRLTDEQREKVCRKLAEVSFASVSYYQVEEFISAFGGRRTGGKPGEGYVKMVEQIIATIRSDEAILAAISKIDPQAVARSERIRAWRAKHILHPRIFSPTASVWDNLDYNDDGTAGGALLPVLTELAKPENRETIDSMLAAILDRMPQRALNSDSTQNAAAEQNSKPDPYRTAQLWQILIQVQRMEDETETATADPDPSTGQESLARRWDRWCESLPKQISKSTDDSARPLNPRWVWQAASILESAESIAVDTVVPDEVRNRSLAAMFGYAFRSGDMDRFAYSPGPKWIEYLLACDRRVDARRLLHQQVRDFRVDSSVAAVNPGYGESLEIQHIRGMSDALLQSGYPADAAALLVRCLDQRTMFQRAGVWRGDNEEQAFDSLYNERVQEVDRQRALGHLRAMVESLQAGRTADIAMIRPRAILTWRDSLGLALSIQKLRGEERQDEEPDEAPEMAESLTEIDRQLAQCMENATDESADVAVEAAAIRLTMKLGGLVNVTLPEVERTAAIDAAISDYQTRRSEAGDIQASIDALLLRMLLHPSSDLPAKSKVAFQQFLVDRLIAAGEDEVMVREALRLASVTPQQRVAAQIQRLEEAYAADADAMVGADDFDAAMRLAETEAVAGRIANSAKLLATALRRGLPLRGVSAASGDAFAIRSGGMQTDSRVNLGRQDRIRILTLVDGWGMALGFPSDLTRWPKTIFDPESLPEDQHVYFYEETVTTTKYPSGTVSDDAADAAMRSLAEILNRKQQVSGQLSYDVSPVDPNRFGDPGDLLNPRSLDIALVNLAMRLERIDAPGQWLGSADDTSAQTPASGATQRPVDRLLAGTWAIAQQDSGAMTRMIDQIAEELKSELPPLDHQ